jgi:hypothetical protein
MKKFVEVFGWYGMAALVAAYALVSFSALIPTSIWYQLLNGTGALGIVVVSFYKRAYQPAALNVIWTLIAVAAIIKLIL